MSRADSQLIVSTLSVSQADLQAFDLYYDEAKTDIARLLWNAEVELIPTPMNDGTYSLPPLSVEVITLFYGGTQLIQISHSVAEVIYGKSWRDLVGSPSCYTFEDESSGNFRIVPKPDRPSTDFIFVFGSSLGEDYPEYSTASLHSHRRDYPPSSLTEFPVAFEILTREYLRESDHQDVTLASYFKQLSNLFLMLLK